VWFDGAAVSSPSLRNLCCMYHRERELARENFPYIGILNTDINSKPALILAIKLTLCQNKQARIVLVNKY
jgi:hypothetical protein